MSTYWAKLDDVPTELADDADLLAVVLSDYADYFAEARGIRIISGPRHVEQHPTDSDEYVTVTACWEVERISPTTDTPT